MKRGIKHSMAEYIEKTSFIEHLKKDPLFDLVEQYGITGVIESFPAADVQTVKHGKWINGLEVPEYERRKHPYVYLNGDTYCSECFAEAYWDTDYGQQLFKYCPNCGAKMDGEI